MSSWLHSSVPHMDGTHTVSVDKYHDGRPGTVTVTVPAGYALAKVETSPTVAIIDAGRWQCYSGTGANEAIEFAVQEFEMGFNPTTWDEVENAVRGLYEREFVPRSDDGATDTEPRCAIQDYGQELASRKGIRCPYDEWEGWL